MDPLRLGKEALIKFYRNLVGYYLRLFKLPPPDAKLTNYPKITQSKADEPEIILNCKNQRALVQTTLELTDLMAKSVSENKMTLVLGGDHSIGIGSIAGHFKVFPNSFVVWVDAHTDVNTPEASSSKNTHGMPLSFLLNETSNLIPRTEGFEKFTPVYV